MAPFKSGRGLEQKRDRAEDSSNVNLPFSDPPELPSEGDEEVYKKFSEKMLEKLNKIIHWQKKSNKGKVAEKKAKGNTEADAISFSDSGSEDEGQPRLEGKLLAEGQEEEDLNNLESSKSIDVIMIGEWEKRLQVAKVKVKELGGLKLKVSTCSRCKVRSSWNTIEVVSINQIVP